MATPLHAILSLISGRPLPDFDGVRLTFSLPASQDLGRGGLNVRGRRCRYSADTVVQRGMFRTHHARASVSCILPLLLSSALWPASVELRFVQMPALPRSAATY